MKLVRHTDAKAINQIVNDPSVHPWVRGEYEGYLDLTPIATNLYNYVLMGEQGGAVFTCHQPGLYEIHTQVLPAGRGAWALDMVKSAFYYMFTRTDAVEITTRVPKGNLAARAMTRAVGGKFEFRNHRGWMLDGKIVYADIYRWLIQDWMQTAEGLTEKGQWFHNKLEQEYIKFGAKTSHTEDPVHDRYVGAAVEMTMGGQARKATIFYNRWAVMAGYAPISVMSEKPLVLDINEALLMFRDNDFWAMTYKAN